MCQTDTLTKTFLSSCKASFVFNASAGHILVVNPSKVLIVLFSEDIKSSFSISFSFSTFFAFGYCLTFKVIWTQSCDEC